MSVVNASRHIQLVESVLNGRDTKPGIREDVVESWRRCFDTYGLDPSADHQGRRVEYNELLSRRERARQLLTIANPELESLYTHIAGSGHGLLLMDPEGVILEYRGDTGFNEAVAERGIALQAGAIWDEATQGTNSAGTSLFEAEPLSIHTHEHFFERNTALTASAAPLRSPTGEIIGVLNAITFSAYAQQYCQALLTVTTRTIESRLFLNSYQEHFIIRFHYQPEVVSTPGEGIISFGADGIVLAANAPALDLLGQEAWERITGQPIDELFDTTVDTLVAQGSHYGIQGLPIHTRTNSRRCHALVRTPALVRSAPRRVKSSRAPSQFDNIEFGDAHMRANIQRAHMIVDKDIPTILYGATGTGKGVLAKALHMAGSRAENPFVAVNCASIPETLIESELFGYRSGAFTGARREGSRGKIVHASSGTLFLDEIGDMPPQLQARLLRVLEDKEVIPLGSEEAIAVDINIISATHRDLTALIQEGRFREDLYYRLYGIALTLPSLRERTDKQRLIQHLIEQELETDGPIAIESRAMDYLLHYEWPGNIRQLRNVLRTLKAVCSDHTIRAADLPDELLNNDPRAATSSPGAEARGPSGESPLASAERETLLSELEACRWNVTELSRKLALSRNTLYRKMKRFGITPPR